MTRTTHTGTLPDRETHIPIILLPYLHLHAQPSTLSHPERHAEATQTHTTPRSFSLFSFSFLHPSFPASSFYALHLLAFTVFFLSFSIVVTVFVIPLLFLLLLRPPRTLFPPPSTLSPVFPHLSLPFLLAFALLLVSSIHVKGGDAAALVRLPTCLIARLSAGSPAHLTFSRVRAESPKQ